jgi:hypothetical protein
MSEKQLPFLAVFVLAMLVAGTLGFVTLPKVPVTDAIASLSVVTALGPFSVFALSSGASELSNLVSFCFVGIAIVVVPALVLRKLSNLLAFAVASTLWTLYGVFVLTLSTI